MSKELIEAAEKAFYAQRSYHSTDKEAFISGYIAAKPAPVAALGEVIAEIRKATAKFPTWPTDPLHAFAVLGEEVGELQKATLQAVYEPHKSTKDDVRNEAIQTAAMAIRFLMSLDAYEYSKCPQHEQEVSHG